MTAHSLQARKALRVRRQVVEWAPQQDLLGDARVCAFVTHGGLNSVYEVRWNTCKSTARHAVTGVLTCSVRMHYLHDCGSSPAPPSQLLVPAGAVLRVARFGLSPLLLRSSAQRASARLARLCRQNDFQQVLAHQRAPPPRPSKGLHITRLPSLRGEPGRRGRRAQAAYHGVPLVGIPMYGDQPDNVAKAVHRGFGLLVAAQHLQASLPASRGAPLRGVQAAWRPWTERYIHTPLKAS